MINHYRMRFPGCCIVVHDNMSTDNTVKIALNNDCEVIPYDTNNQLQDRRYIEIKNNCWKNALTDWVLVCDTDELLDINAEELKKEGRKGFSFIKSKGYEMVNMKDNLDIANIKYGYRYRPYDKTVLFNKKLIREINYTIGAHGCNPVGTASYSKKAYRLYHYRMVNEGLTVKKFKTYAPKLSPENLKNGWGTNYLMTPKDIHEDYILAHKQATRLLK